MILVTVYGLVLSLVFFNCLIVPKSKIRSMI
jgi:hypothetical protein